MLRKCEGQRGKMSNRTFYIVTVSVLMLAGAVAANTTLPVIGIPISCKNTGGMDALLATVQMPSGIPVATVAIDGAANAATLAVQILAVSDSDLAAKLKDTRKKATATVLEKNAAIEAKFNS